MTRLWWVFGVLAVAASAVAQGGFGGGGFGGGQGGFGGGGQGQGQGGAAQGQGRDGSDSNLRGPFPYLNQAETTSILTPGEYVEWTLDLKQSQVVIAEARSEAFDPALEIVEGEKVLMDNDDRYPGDQRPLLMWTCPKDGKYLLRIRSFRGRAGGQVFSRHVVLNCRQVVIGSNVLGDLGEQPVLLRVALKAGDVVQPLILYQDNIARFMPSTAITSVGLPCPNLIPEITAQISRAICAPVDGDYYFYAGPELFTRPNWHVLIERVPVVPVASLAENSVQQGRHSSIWSITLKKGDFVKLDLGGSRFGPQLRLEPAPDLSAFDPKHHPFAPRPPQDRIDAFATMPVIGEGESAIGVIARQDCTLWVTRSATDQREPHRLSIMPGSQEIPAGTAEGRLAMNSVQHWDFQAKAGDVVKLTTTIKGFASILSITAPNHQRIASMATYAEDDRAQSVFVASQTGRYIVSVSCQGNGGTGTYSINRQVVPPEVLQPDTPIEHELPTGDVKVYKVTFDTGTLKLLKVQSAREIQLTNATGGAAHIEMFRIGQTLYYHGIFSSPTSFLLVVRGGGPRYRLSFVDPP